MDYTFNSQFTFNNSPKLEEKKTSLLEKVLSKRDELGYSTADLTNRQVEVLDGDTLRVKASPTDLAQNPNETHFDIRLKPNDFNASYDAYENKLHTDNIDARTEAKLSKQRQAIEDNEWFKGWFNPATNEDVFERGQVTQQKLQDTINAQQGLKIKYQGLDQNNRVLADILDSRSNESIINALNTEEDNASYNTKYNEGFRKQVDSTPLESLQDAATSFGIGATVLSGQALVGTADLAQGLLKKSLGIEDTPSITDYLQEVGYDPLKTKQVLDETFHTDKFLAKQKKLQKAMTSSDDEWENAKNTAKFLLDNPEHLITGTVMESLPMMLQGGLLAKASKNPLLIGAIAEGTQSAGMIADTADIQGRTQEQYVTPSIAAGIGTGAINLGMNSLAGDALISAMTKGQAGKTTLTKALFGEATEEALQTAQEQVFTNIAEGEEDIFKGIGSNTVLGAAAGAATGGPIQAVHSTANTLSNALKPKEIQTPAQEDTVQSEQSSNKPKSFGIQDETFTQYGIVDEDTKQNIRNEFAEMDSLLKDSKQVENIQQTIYDDSSKEELLNKLNTVNFGNLSPEAEKNLSIISDKFRNDYNNSTELTDPFIKNELNIDSSNLDPEATEIARKVAKGELDSNFDLPALTQAISKNIEPEAKPDNISLMEHLLTNIVKNEPSKLNDTSFQSKLISGLNTLQSIKQGTIPKVNENTTPEEFKFILENNLGSLNWTKEQRTEIDNGIKILQEQIKKEPSNEELKKILNNYKRYEGFISALENTKDIDTVSSEVLNGSTTEDGQRKPSANQWLQLITLKSNDKNTANKLLGQLIKWSEYHSKKSNLLSQISSILESRVNELPDTLIKESRDPNTKLGKLFAELEEVQINGGAFSTKVNAKQYQLIGDAEDGKHLYNAFDKLTRQVNFEANYLKNTIKLAKGIINPELVSESSTIDSKPQNQESSIDASTEETNQSKPKYEDTQPNILQDIINEFDPENKFIKPKGTKQVKPKKNKYKSLLQIIASHGGLKEEDLEGITDGHKPGRWFKRANTKSKVQPKAMYEMLEQLHADGYYQLNESNFMDVLTNLAKGFHDSRAYTSEGLEAYLQEQAELQYDEEQMKYHMEITALLEEAYNTDIFKDLEDQINSDKLVNAENLEDKINELNTRTEEENRKSSFEEIPTKTTTESKIEEPKEEFDLVNNNKDKTNIPKEILDIQIIAEKFPAEEFQNDLELISNTIQINDKESLMNILKIQNPSPLLKFIKAISNLFQIKPLIDNLQTKEELNALIQIEKFQIEFKEAFIKKVNLNRQFFDKLGYVLQEQIPVLDEKGNQVYDAKGNPQYKNTGLPNENVIAAMGFAALAYLNQNTKSVFNTTEMIQSIFGKDENFFISDEVNNLFADVGKNFNHEAPSIGKAASRLLGFKAKDSHKTSLVEAAMGNMAINTLIEMGFLQLHFIPKNIMNSVDKELPITEEIPPKNEEALKAYIKEGTYFISPTKNPDLDYPVIHDEIKEYLLALKISKRVLEPLLNMDFEAENFSIEPFTMQSVIKRLGNKWKNSFTDYTDAERKAILNYSNIKYTNQTRLAKVNLEEDVLKEIGLGYSLDTIILDVNEKIHKGKLIQVNRNIEEVNKVSEALKTNKGLYFFNELVRSGREMMLGGGQSNKYLRWFLVPEGSKRTLKFDDKDQTHFLFKVAILAAFGEKVHKKLNKINELFDVYLNSMDEIYNIYTLSNEFKVLNTEQQKIIRDKVFDLGEGYHSLAGLVELMAYKKSLEDKSKTFSTSLLREDDGITNGPFIGYLLYGDFDNSEDNQKSLNSFAVSTTNHNFTYSNFADNSGLDSYELIRDELLKQLGNINPSIQNLLGDINRNFTKNPVTKNIFGSSIVNIAKIIGYQATNNIYNFIQDKINKITPDSSENEVNKIISEIQEKLFHLDRVLNSNYSNQSLTVDELKNFKISLNHKEQLKNIIQNTIQSPLEKAVSKYWFSVMDNRQVFNRVYAIGNEIAKKLLQQKVENVIQERFNSQKNEHGKYTLFTKEDLNKILEELKDILPNMEIPNFDETNHKVYFWDLDKSPKYGKKAYQVQVEFNTGKDIQIHYMDENGRAKTKDVSTDIRTHLTTISGYILESIGVKVPIGSIHNADSIPVKKIMNSMYKSLLVHDGVHGAITDVDELSYEMNKAIYNHIKAFNPYTSLLKYIEEINKYLSDPIMDTDVTQNLRQNLTVINEDGKREEISASQLINNSSIWAKEKAKQKENNISQIKALGNYGGNFTFKPKVAEYVQEHLNDSIKDIIEEVSKKSNKEFIKRITSILENKYLKPRTTTVDMDLDWLNSYLKTNPYTKEQLNKLLEDIEQKIIIELEKYSHILPVIKEAVESENEISTESNQESTTKVGFILSQDKKGKDQFKASIANAYIGYGVDSSSTTKYANNAKEQGIPVNEEINPTKDTIAFVSVNGNNKLTEQNKENTLIQIRRVLNAGGSIVMDNDTNANTAWNRSGEQVIQNELKKYYKFRISKNGEFNIYRGILNQESNSSNDTLGSTPNIINFNEYPLDSLFDNISSELYDEEINKENIKNIINTFISELKDYINNNSIETLISKINIKFPDLELNLKEFYINSNTNIGSTPGVSSTNPFIGDNSILTSENVEASLEELFTEDRNIVDSVEHQNYLRDTIKDLIAKVMKPIEYYQTKDGDTTYGFIDPTFSKVAVNIAQTVNQNYSGIKMSAATTYVHELIHAVTGIALTSPEHFNLYRETVRLFNHVKSNLTSEQIERYAYVFKNDQTVRQTYTNTKGIQQEHIYNQGILEFIAYAKTEPELMKLIEDMPDMKDIRLQDMPLNQAISSVFNRIMDWFNKVVLNKDLSTRGRIDAITLALSTAHIKRKPSLLGKVVIPDTWNKYAIDKAKDLIAKPLLDLNQKINNKSSNRVIKNTTNTIANLVNVDWKNINASFREGARKLGVIDNNIISSLTTESAGNTLDMKKFHKQIAIRKLLRDHFVNKEIETISKILSDAFTRKLTKGESETITRIGIKGDISYLSKIYSDEDLIKFLSDESFRQEEISNLQDKLIANPYRQYFINQTRNLGSFIINNTFLKEEHINAHNVDLIINNLGLIDEHYKPEENLRDTLKQLSRLYAMEFMQQSDKDSFIKLMKEEPEGIATTLKGHDNYKKNYLNKILKGNKLLVVDGAIKESYNPNRSLVIANSKEGKELVKQGYYKNPIKLKRSGIDNSDSDMYLWFADVKMLQTYQQAGTAFTELHDSLSNFMEGYTASDSTKQIMSKLSKNAIPRNALKDAIRLSNSRTNRNNPEEQNSLTPKYNQDGRIIGFTYTLHESIKDEYLDRVMKHDYVMASMNASIIDQLATQPINEKMIDTLIQDQKEFVRYPKLFVQIGPDSPNKEYRDIWFRLPKQTKEMVKEKTGFDYLMVREEALDYVFGYRKVSAANWIRPYTVEELANHKHIKQLGNWIFDHLNPNNKFMNMHNLRKVESGIQEAVKMAKDTIVIKLPKTLIANELSNIVILHTRGIPTDFIIKEKAEALTNAKLYFKTTKEILELEYLMKIDSKYNTKDNQNRLNQLHTLQTQNPVHQLVQEGVFQTIVEDIAANEGLWNWKSRYEDKLEKLGEKVPKIIKETGKFIAMTHDTKMYKFLHDTTQVSDLTARYVLHKWNLQQGMKLEESLDDIVSTFVNYELPTHRFIEYGNEMGIFMFTKYFFRILKPMVKETLNHPLNVAALHMLQMFYMFESIHNIELTDVFNKINDPFSTIFSVVDANPFYQAVT